LETRSWNASSNPNASQCFHRFYAAPKEQRAMAIADTPFLALTDNLLRHDFLAADIHPARSATTPKPDTPVLQA
jgi:hypothetical protein